MTMLLPSIGAVPEAVRCKPQVTIAPKTFEPIPPTPLPTLDTGQFFLHLSFERECSLTSAAYLINAWLQLVILPVIVEETR